MSMRIVWSIHVHTNVYVKHTREHTQDAPESVMHQIGRRCRKGGTCTVKYHSINVRRTYIGFKRNGARFYEILRLNGFGRRLIP